MGFVYFHSKRLRQLVVVINTSILGRIMFKCSNVFSHHKRNSKSTYENCTTIQSCANLYEFYELLETERKRERETHTRDTVTQWMIFVDINNLFTVCVLKHIWNCITYAIVWTLSMNYVRLCSRNDIEHHNHMEFYYVLCIPQNHIIFSHEKKKKKTNYNLGYWRKKKLCRYSYLGKAHIDEWNVLRNI